MTELALLARELGVHERTLRRAVNQGGLRARWRGPRTLDIPLSERQYVRRAWPLMASLRSALRTEPNVRFALLFGSAASGTDTPTSDVDLLVELREPGLDQVVDLGQRLTAASGRRVEVVRLGDAERDPLFLADVFRDGRVLVDREGVWPRLRSRERAVCGRVRHNEARRTEAALAGIDRLLAS